MMKYIGALAVLGVAVLTMGQSCSYVPGDAPTFWTPGPSTWEGWIEEGNYVWWSVYTPVTATTKATGKTINYYIIIIPLEDLQRFREGKPYRSYCVLKIEDARYGQCSVTDAGIPVAVIVWVPWVPDFISGDLYMKVWIR